GFEYLTQAEKRTGFPLKTLYAILAAAKVKIRRVPSRPEKKRGKYRGRRRSQRMVLITDVDAAVALRLKQETVHKQAHARGVAPETLARRLKALGVNRAGRKRRLMVTDEQVQRALAAKLVRTRAAHGHYTGARFVEATA
ncbi:MAG TPA: hypothetical protein VHM19_11100, partial [Polyangiales bacterium]|nr:hypothetical protein [Polyangiales bacterium]